ncbi:MAG: hypothetical protein ACR2NH_02100 [Solirubrobacteraceae bacterium]
MAERDCALPGLRAARIVGRVDLARHGEAVLDARDGPVVATLTRSGQLLGQLGVVGVGLGA